MSILKQKERLLTSLQRDRAGLALRASAFVMDKAARVLVSVRGDNRLSLTACYLLHTWVEPCMLHSQPG